MLRHAIAPKDGIHALHWAARGGHLPLVQCLVNLFPVDLPGENGGTALQAAARSHKNPLVEEYLLLNGADVNRADDRGHTAIHYAFAGTVTTAGHKEHAEDTVRLLIAHGADVNVVAQTAPYFPLQAALYTRFLGVARLLLDAGADPEWIDDNGDPLVVVVARVGDTEELELLLDYGANIDGSNSHESNPLLIATQYGCLGTVKMLVERGAKLNCVDNDGDTPLVLAIAYRHEDIAAYLVGLEGIDIMKANHEQDVPVNLAALVGYDAVLSKLLERGGPVDYVDRQGRTALHTAILNGWVGIVQMLLNNGANLEMVDSIGNSPLLSAIQNRDLSITGMLLVHGADPTTCATGGSPPLTLACRLGSEEIVSLLLEQGVDVNREDREGKRPMAWAQIGGYSTVVEILAAHGGVF